MTTLKNCKTCGRDADWHVANTPRHPFNDGTVPGSETFGVKLPGGGRGPVGTPEERPELTLAAASPQWPFDPVLRQALIDKGVLTPDDLSEAERKIRAVTAQFIQGGDINVQGTD